MSSAACWHEDREVTAIFAANDEMALGVMRAMFEAGREVPRRQHHRVRRRPLRALSDAAAHHRPPGLRGDRAAQRADAAGRDRGIEAVRVRAAITPELVVRESTAPAVIRA